MPVLQQCLMESGSVTSLANNQLSPRPPLPHASLIPQSVPISHEYTSQPSRRLRVVHGRGYKSPHLTPTRPLGTRAQVSGKEGADTVADGVTANVALPVRIASAKQQFDTSQSAAMSKNKPALQGRPRTHDTVHTTELVQMGCIITKLCIYTSSLGSNGKCLL